MALREQDKHFLASLYSAAAIIFVWKGLWEGLYELPYIGDAFVALFVGFTMLIFSGLIFKEFDPLGGLEQAVLKKLDIVIHSPEKGNFVLNIIKEAEDKEVVEVGCNQIVSPTYAGDLSRATLKLLTSEAKPGIYHLINEEVCNWHEFTKEIFTLANINKELKPVNRSDFDGKVKRPKFSALKNTKARALGITLPSWQEGLRSYFNFLNNNG